MTVVAPELGRCLNCDGLYFHQHEVEAGACDPCLTGPVRTNGRTVTLRPRELRVIGLVARGMQQKEIALALGVHPHIVVNDLVRVRLSVNARTTHQAVAKLVRAGAI